MDLKGKVAIITGGAVRIGRALSLALAKAGCNLFIHYGHSGEAAKKTVAQARKYNIKSLTFSADLSNPSETAKVIPAAIDAFGAIDILINNAAIFPEEDTFESTDTNLWEKIFAINLQAPFILSRDFASQITEDRDRKIININDARILRPARDHFAYRLAKRGLWDMTKLLALELAPNIQVNTLALGAILSPAHKDIKHMEKIRKERIPLRRIGSPQLVAENVLHLLRQDFVTGTTTTLDGGEFLQN